MPSIKIPTDTMEQEFQNYYRRGFEAGKKAAAPPSSPAGRQEAQDHVARELAAAHAQNSEAIANGWRNEMLTSFDTPVGWKRRALEAEAKLAGRQEAPTMFNGLTEDETSATASVAGLSAGRQGAIPEVAELLKGWKLNHVQFERGSGTAEIGYLDPEDDRFSPIIKVDTGLYYRPQDAAPLASAILAAIAAAPTSPERAPDPARAALAELVALEDLKFLIAMAERHPIGTALEDMRAEYERRKPAAWAAAKEVLKEQGND